MYFRGDRRASDLSHIQSLLLGPHRAVFNRPTTPLDYMHVEKAYRLPVPVLGVLRQIGELRPKDAIPKATRHAKAIFVVEEMVLEVILLQLLVPQRKVLVVEEIVCQVVADVAENAAAIDGCSHIPVPEEQRMCDPPEGRGQNDEERRWHDQAVLVHGEVVVDTVQQEVRGDAPSVIRQVSNGRAGENARDNRGPVRPAQLDHCKTYSSR